MKLSFISKTLLTFTIILTLSSSILACPSLSEEMSSTSNIFSPELIWGLFIILLHMVMGLVHTWFREKKNKKE
ncbi:MAG: hypothetical protein HY819_03015 [Acidobacteria bacterium]|nr:hypothetical protein [Acidobacteriota bacterium]